MLIEEQMGIRGVVCFIVLIILPLALASSASGGDDGLQILPLHNPIRSMVLNADMVIP